jgi:flagellar biogenesis protein FliO
MGGWTGFFFLLGAALVVFILYRQIKSNPQAFSRENLSKSFGTMAILALLLIAFIAFLVFILRTK